MSIRLMADVYDCGPTNAGDCAVLVCLANFANDDGVQCFPDIPRIARMVRRDASTVKRTIRRLERGGWLTVERGCGRGIRSQYTLNVERLKGRQNATFSASVAMAEKVALTTGKGGVDDNPPHPPLGVSVRNRQLQTIPPYPPREGGEGGTTSGVPEAATARTGRVRDGVGASDGGLGVRVAAGGKRAAVAGAVRGAGGASQAAERRRGAAAVRAAAGGDRNGTGDSRDAGDSAVDACVERVSAACGWVDRRVRRTLAETLAQDAAAFAGAEREAAVRDAGDAIVRAWRQYQRSQPELRYQVLPRKFLALGLWREDAAWPWWQPERHGPDATIGVWRGGMQ